MPDSSIIQALRIIEWHEQQKRTAQARRFGRKRKLTGQDLQDAVDELNLPKAARRVVMTRASRVDRSAEATVARTNALVDVLFSGTRCSLSRAYKLANYGKHHPHLKALLLNKGILARMRWHIDQGHSAAPKYFPAILEALGIDEAALREDWELFGIKDP
jgi:hypothetical protein